MCVCVCVCVCFKGLGFRVWGLGFKAAKGLRVWVCRGLASARLGFAEMPYRSLREGLYIHLIEALRKPYIP